MKKQSPTSNFKLVTTSPSAISRIGIISGRASAAIIGAALPKIESAPQKQQIKLTSKLTKIISSKRSGLISEDVMMIGTQQISQFANIFAAIKISKFSQEIKICSLAPDSKSFFRNSAEEKIRQESRENKIMTKLSWPCESKEKLERKIRKNKKLAKIRESWRKLILSSWKMMMKNIGTKFVLILADPATSAGLRSLSAHLRLFTPKEGV